MPRFSLVIATLGRTEELQSLLGSLERQQMPEIEVIIVDQNEDERLQPILAATSSNLEIVHLRESQRGVSRARNIGLDRARGELVAFPDDDCWYPDDLLRSVETWFARHPETDILAVGAQDEEGLSSGNRWPQDQCAIRPYNALRTTFASSLFLRQRAVREPVRFDPRVSFGEETDYILKLLKKGYKGRFDRSMHVGHPRRDMLSGTVSHQRARHYGAGMGQLVRRHSLFLLWGALMSYELLRIGAVVLKGDVNGAGFCWAHAQGLFWGFARREA